MPFFVQADIVTPTGHRFRLKVTEHEVKVFPMDGFSFADLMHLYQTLVERVDPEAELVPRPSG